MTSAIQFSEESAISESQQLSSKAFLINALKLLYWKQLLFFKKAMRGKLEKTLSISTFVPPNLYRVWLWRKNSAGICRTNSRIKTNAPHKLFLVKSLETWNPKQIWNISQQLKAVYCSICTAPLDYLRAKWNIRETYKFYTMNRLYICQFTCSAETGECCEKKSYSRYV